jgi:hypothetical protein
MHSKLNSPAQDIIFLKSNSSPKGKSHKIKAKKKTLPSTSVSCCAWKEFDVAPKALGP